MARKRKGVRVGRILVLGGLAAAGYAAYKNRDRIAQIVSELTGSYAPEDADLEAAFEVEEMPKAQEADIVIDRSGESEEDEETPEDAPDAAVGEN